MVSAPGDGSTAGTFSTSSANTAANPLLGRRREEIYETAWWCKRGYNCLRVEVPVYVAMRRNRVSELYPSMNTNVDLTSGRTKAQDYL